MNIISWNINGFRAIEKKNFYNWLEAASPDILCLQETKLQAHQRSDTILQLEGYHTYWAYAKRRGYSGTALFSRTKPNQVHVLGVDAFDNEGRVLMAEFDTSVVICAYFPNSQEGGKRLDYKLAFCDAMLDVLDSIIKGGKDIILCGDYNIAHKPIDLANPKRNEKNPGYLPEERGWMDTFTSNGYIDTFRQFNSEPDNYTWWSYRFKAREKNIGWRIDYHCVNEAFMDKVKESRILSDVMGSDHCPVLLQTAG